MRLPPRKNISSFISSAQSISTFCAASVLLNIGYNVQHVRRQLATKGTNRFGNLFSNNCEALVHRTLAGLSFDPPIPNKWHIAYNGENEALVDEPWASLQLDIDADLAALSDKYTKVNDLLYAQSLPWQNNMGIYFLNGLHCMHCLVSLIFSPKAHGLPHLMYFVQKNVRRAFFDHRKGEPQSASSYHINHCMDTIRQDLMCFADDAPRNTGTTGPMEFGVG